MVGWRQAGVTHKVLKLDYLFPVESEVFVVGDVAELVAKTLGITNSLVYVAVGVAINPIVDSAAGDVVG